MPIFCPICNKSSAQSRFFGAFCESCMAQKLKREISKHARIYQCRFCERLKIKGTFYDYDKNSLGKALNVAMGLKDAKVIVEDFKNGWADLNIIFHREGENMDVKAGVSVKVAHETCQKCYRISAGYYQGVIQVRGNRMKMERFVEGLKRYVERRDGFISKIEDQQNGYDIYVSDKSVANSFFVERKIKVEKSFRFYGMKRGVKLYRNTYAVHL